MTRQDTLARHDTVAGPPEAMDQRSPVCTDAIWRLPVTVCRITQFLGEQTAGDRARTASRLTGAPDYGASRGERRGTGIAIGSLTELGVTTSGLMTSFGVHSKDVAERDEGVHAYPLWRLGDRPVDLLTGESDAAFVEKRHQVGGLEHLPLGHQLLKLPLVVHPLEHVVASQ